MWPEVTVARPMLHVGEILGTFPGLPPISLPAGSLISRAGLLGGLLGCVIPKTGSIWAHRRASTSGVETGFPRARSRRRFPSASLRGLSALPTEVSSPWKGLFSSGVLSPGGKRVSAVVSRRFPRIWMSLCWNGGARFFLKREGWASERVSGECIPLTQTPWFVKKCLVREATAPLQRAFLRSSALLWGELGSREVNLIQHH